MHVLITGGNGFIGRSLTPILLDEGYQITLLDRQKRVYNNDKVVQVNIDFREKNQIAKLLSSVDVVIHLAALLGVDACEKSAKNTLRANGLDACEFFDLCKENGVKHIIYTSSSEVYGDVDVADENSPMNPKSDYGVAKLYSEKYLSSISEGNLSSHILRLFSIYGCDQRDDFVIPKFMKQASLGHPITLYGDGSQIRAFCHVSDVSNAIDLCLKHHNDVSGCKVLNIGNHKQPITIKSLALKILKIYNRDPDKFLKMVPLSDTTRGEKREIYKRTPSIKKARKEINYSPQVLLEEGLLTFINKN